MPKTRIYNAYENAVNALYEKTKVRGLIRYPEAFENLRDPSKIIIDDPCRELIRLIAKKNESVTKFLEEKNPWELNSDEIKRYYELANKIETPMKKKKGENDENYSIEDSFIAETEELESSSQINF